MATGYTVSSGTTPEPFSAEILGVYPDAMLPGHDLIIVETHSPAIDKAGGIWYGMSGSPVYRRGKLVGAVAWQLSWGPSHIVGLTPGQEMMDVLRYGSGTASVATAGARRVRLTDRMRRDVAMATGASEDEVGDSFRQLKTPVSVSGLAGRGLQRMQNMVTRRGRAWVLYPGSSVAASARAAAGAVSPGSNFASVISYGDVTYSGVGTTTFVCDGFAMAFGHPFDFDGVTTMGANAASAITIWEDPLFGPFKLATVKGAVGTVDQDRFAGIRADLSQVLTTIPVTSTTRAENTGRVRDGRTEVTLSEWVPEIAPFHVYSNILSAMDQYSGGSSEATWTVTGTRADGSTWQLVRSNMYAGDYELPWDTTHEMLHMLARLYYQDFDKIKFTSVDVDVTAREQIRQYKIVKVLVSNNGGDYLPARDLRVRPGATLRVRVELEPYLGTVNRVVDLAVKVPWSARGEGQLRIFGGCGCHAGMVGKASSFDDLLAKMHSLPQNNEANSTLRFGTTVARDFETLDQVVRGSRSMEVMVVR